MPLGVTIRALLIFKKRDMSCSLACYFACTYTMQFSEISISKDIFLNDVDKGNFPKDQFNNKQTYKHFKITWQNELSTG